MQEFFVWITGASLVCAAVLGAHALRVSYSLAPIYVCLGFVSSTMMWLVTVGARIEFYDLTVLWGSTFFAALLLGVFVLYVFDGTQSARLATLTTIGVILATFLLESSLAWQASHGISEMHIAWPSPPPRLYLGSALAAAVDLVVMAILWESLYRWRGTNALTASIFVTLLGTLALDSLIFPLLAFGRVPEAQALMQGSLAERLILLLWLSPVLAAYVRWQQKLHGSDLGRGKVLSILVGSAMSEKRLSRAEAEIRERMRVEEQLRQSETVLQTVLDNCRAVMFLKDAQGRYLLVNSFFEEALGVDKNSAVGRSDFDLRDPDTAQRMANFDAQVVESGAGLQYEEEVLGPDGQTRTYVTNKVPLFDETGQVYALCGFATDISDRKLSEKRSEENQRRLQLHQRRLQLAMDAAAAGTFVWNFQSSELEWDQRSLEIFGLSQDSFKETYLDWMRHVHPDDQEVLQATLQESLGDSRWEHEYRVVRPDGEVRTVAAAGYFTLGNDGEPEMLFGLHLDVTEQRLAQRALHEAKYSAEQANRAKSDFLATMSHEIRTPMNAVIGMTHLIGRTELTAKQADYVRKIESSAKSLLGIINDILDFSKIEAGKLEFETVDFNLDTVLENLAHIMAVRKAEKESLEVLFRIDPDVPRYLNGDPLRLGQVLTNLGANAIKFTESGQVLVAVKCLEQDQQKAVLEFRVEDTGIGMSMDEQKRLFQPFSQTDSSTTRKYGGTGLGLSICKRIVDLMNGRIIVESEPGRGSRFLFSVTLPLASQNPSPARHLSADLRHLEVLVADDNATSREILEELLLGFGYKVTLASTGLEALDEVKARKALKPGQSKPFDLVLLDWKMPGMDGIEAAKQIQQSCAEAPPVTILVTAYGREDVARSAQTAGVSSVLSKPVNESLLFDAIANAFGTQSPIPPSAPQRGTVTFSGQRVLLVEDNEVNQQVARELLEQAKLEVFIAGHGREAVEALKQQQFDIVLMDVQMPVMDGLTATRLIRKDKLAPKTPIVAMTANAMQGDRDICLDAGMDDYVAKPIEPDELMATLRRYLQPSHSSSPAPTAAGEEWQFPIIHGLDPKPDCAESDTTPLFIANCSYSSVESKVAPL